MQKCNLIFCPCSVHISVIWHFFRFFDHKNTALPSCSNTNRWETHQSTSSTGKWSFSMLSIENLWFSWKKCPNFKIGFFLIEPIFSESPIFSHTQLKLWNTSTVQCQYHKWVLFNNIHIFELNSSRVLLLPLSQ